MLPRNVALHTSSQLMPIKAWRSRVSTIWEGGGVSSEVRLENCTQVFGVGQIWTACNSRLKKYSASHLSEPVHNTVTMNVRRAMSFFCTFECSYSSVLRPILLKLHISSRLFESFPMVYELWSCIEVKLSISLGAHAQRPKESFDCGNVLDLRPVLLKIACFHSANRKASIDVQHVELR